VIRYALTCTNGHGFEGWFSGHAGFEDLRKRGLAACPVCGSNNVEKALMAPAIARRDLEPARPVTNGEAGTPAPSPEAEAPRPVALLSEKEQALRAMIKLMREHVVANTDDVGARFPDEARKIHYGETDPRAIRGVASPTEARELHEEGIAFQLLPTLPDERN
jgi:hypothetical protein